MARPQRLQVRQRLWIVSVLLLLKKALALSQQMRPTALVTGSTDGIGVTTAKNLMLKGYNVIVHGRDPKRIEKACETIRSFQDNEDGLLFSVCANLETVKGSTQVAREVETLCEKHNLQLTVLMNNAGVYAEDLKITSDGTEETFAVNVVAPFVITSLLLPALLKQKSRIIIASSISQCSSIRHWDDINYKQRPYSAHRAYSESKLFDAMLSMEFAHRLKDAGIGTDRITCNCLDPGTVNTKMLLAGWGSCGINVEDALDQTWLCSSEDLSDVTGEYFVWKSSRRASSDAYDPNERANLWTILSDLAPEAATMWTFDWQTQS